MFRSNHLSDFPQAYEPWAEVSRANRGIPEVSVQWVANHGHAVRLVDVRQPDELAEPLGHIADVESAPLMSLLVHARNWDHDKPIVLICRSGGRSAQAALLLEQIGFSHVASMAGGMLEWRRRDLPVAYRRE